MAVKSKDLSFQQTLASAMQREEILKRMRFRSLLHESYNEFNCEMLMIELTDEIISNAAERVVSRQYDNLAMAYTTSSVWNELIRALMECTPAIDQGCQYGFLTSRKHTSQTSEQKCNSNNVFYPSLRASSIRPSSQKCKIDNFLATLESPQELSSITSQNDRVRKLDITSTNLETSPISDQFYPEKNQSNDSDIMSNTFTDHFFDIDSASPPDLIEMDDFSRHALPAYNEKLGIAKNSFFKPPSHTSRHKNLASTSSPIISRLREKSLSLNEDLNSNSYKSVHNPSKILLRTLLRHQDQKKVPRVVSKKKKNLFNSEKNNNYVSSRKPTTVITDLSQGTSDMAKLISLRISKGQPIVLNANGQLSNFLHNKKHLKSNISKTESGVDGLEDALSIEKSSPVASNFRRSVVVRISSPLFSGSSMKESLMIHNSSSNQKTDKDVRSQQAIKFSSSPLSTRFSAPFKDQIDSTKGNLRLVPFSKLIRSSSWGDLESNSSSAPADKIVVCRKDSVTPLPSASASVIHLPDSHNVGCHRCCITPDSSAIIDIPTSIELADHVNSMCQKPRQEKECHI